MRKISGSEFRAARALADLTIAQLAEAAGVSALTVQRVESTGHAKDDTIASIVAALEKRNVTFLFGGGVSVIEDGVRLPPILKTDRPQFSGQAMRRARERANMSLQQLAGETKLAVGTLRKMEEMSVVSGRASNLYAIVNTFARHGTKLAKLD
jgi:transcriptional regulator with XRE-family HTH domain